MSRCLTAALIALTAACAGPSTADDTLEHARRRMERPKGGDDLLAACRALEAMVQRGGARDRQLQAIRVWVDCLARTGELDRAATALAGLPRAARLYGQALVTVGRDPAALPRAVGLLDQAAAAWPAEAEPPYRAAVLLLADDQPAKALPRLERAARLRDSAAVAVARAHALLDLGRTEEALTEVRRVPGLDPGEAELRKGRALIQRIARRTRTVPRDARKAYREALDLLQHTDRAGQCIRALEGILLDHPRLAAAYTLLGLAHLRLGNAADAVVALRRALELNPLDATNPLYLAVIYQKRGQLPQSITYFRRALELDPFLVRAARELAQLLLREGRAKEAATVLERLVSLDRDSETTQRLAGRAHMAAGALRRAERYFAGLAARDPDDFELNLRLGQLLLRRYQDEGRPGLLERAAKHTRRAARARPDDAEVEELQLQLRQAQQGSSK